MKNIKRLGISILVITIITSLFVMPGVSSGALADIAEFDLGSVSNQNLYMIEEDIDLPESHTAQSGQTYDITWESQNTSVIKNSGVVVRPAEDTFVTLTASFSQSGALAGERSFDLRVYANGEIIGGDGFDWATAKTDITPVKNNDWVKDAPKNAEMQGLYPYVDKNPADADKEFAKADKVLVLDRRHYTGEIIGGNAITLSRNEDVSDIFTTRGTSLSAESYAYEFDLMFEDVSIGQLWYYIYNSSSKMIARIDVSGSILKLRYYDINTKKDEYKNQTIASNTWYRIKIIFDSHNMSYDFYMGDTLVYENVPATHFVSNGEELADLKFKGGKFCISRGTSNTSKVYLDNFVLRTITGEAAMDPDLLSQINELTFDKITNQGQYMITDNVTLPDNFVPSNGGVFDVSWVSSNEDIISNTGEVIRPKYNEYVTLTAYLMRDGDQATGRKSFTVRVLAEGAQNISETFTPNLTYPIGSEILGYNGWAMEGNATGPGAEAISSVLAPSPTDESDTAMKIVRTASSTANWRPYKSLTDFTGELIALTEGEVLVSARFYMCENGYYAFTVRNDKNFVGMVTLSKLDNNDASVYFRYHDGEREVSQLLKSNYCAAERWYDLAMVFDMSARSYSVYIDGVKISDTPIDFFYAEDPDRNDSISRLVADVSRTYSYGSMYVDDIAAIALDESLIGFCDLKFKNGLGFDTEVITSGGKIKGITFMGRSELSGVKIIAAVYDKDGKFLGAGVNSITEPIGINNKQTFSLDVKLPEDVEDIEIKIFLWEDTLSFAPVADPIIYGKTSADNRKVIYIVGASATQSYPDSSFPQAGWGQMLGNYFNSDEIVISNHAVGGRSSKSFIEEGRLDFLLSYIKPGDYLFIVFGGNDLKTDHRYTDPDTTFKECLTIYIDEARKRGATPVLITQGSRRIFKEGVFDQGANMKEYPRAMRELAAVKDVMLVDLMAFTVEIINALGEEGSKDLFLHLEPYDPRYINDPRFAFSDYNKDVATVDNSHYSMYGADIMAGFIAGKAAELDETLEEYKIPHIPVKPVAQ